MVPLPTLKRFTIKQRDKFIIGREDFFSVEYIRVSDFHGFSYLYPENKILKSLSQKAPKSEFRNNKRCSFPTKIQRSLCMMRCIDFCTRTKHRTVFSFPAIVYIVSVLHSSTFHILSQFKPSINIGSEGTAPGLLLVALFSTDIAPTS